MYSGRSRSESILPRPKKRFLFLEIDIFSCRWDLEFRVLWEKINCMFFFLIKKYMFLS